MDYRCEQFSNMHVKGVRISRCNLWHAISSKSSCVVKCDRDGNGDKSSLDLFFQSLMH